MKSELSFLLDLVLDDQTPGPMRAKLVARVREVEKNYAQDVTPRVVSRGTKQIPAAMANQPVVAAQSPSMQRLMADNPDLIPRPPVPVTSAAAEALAKRQAIMNGALSEKPEPGRKSPRKF